MEQTLDKTIQRETPAMTATAKGDKWLWGIYVALCMISVVELYSASSQEVNVNKMFGVYNPLVIHLAHLGLGFMIVWYIQSRTYLKFVAWGPALALLSLVMMIAVLTVGKDINGARRSLDLKILTVYPSEFIKLSGALLTALIMAWTYSNHKNEKRKRLGLILCSGITLLFGAVLITQGLSNTIILMGISFSMMIIGGVSFKDLAKVFGVYVLGALLFLGITIVLDSAQSVQPQQMEQVVIDGQMVERPVERKSTMGKLMGRFETWTGRIQRHRGEDELEKYDQPINDKNMQEMYSYMAQAHGGLRGVLPGNSRETARVPLAVSDYIYCIIVEEWGLIGGLVVMALYLWLLARASTIASRCNQRFAALLVIGMAVMIVLQALFHMAVVTGVFPVSGQPLPLISKGGTAIIVNSIAFGAMISVSRFGLKTGKRQDVVREREAIPEILRSDNPNQL